MIFANATDGPINFVSRISDSLRETLFQLWDNGMQLIPRLAAMLAILLVGYIVARLARWTSRKVLQRLQFDGFCDRSGLHDVTASFGIRSATEMLAQVGFWGIMVLFLVAAVDALGMDSVTQSMNSLVAYIPKVIGASVIVIFGLMLANFVRSMVAGTAERLGMDYGAAAGQLAYGILVIVIGSMAISQLDLKTDLVDRVIEITLMACGAGLAIALGFGSRDISRHVVAGMYARDSFPAGSTVEFDGHTGNVESVEAVNTVVRKADGSAIRIPNAQLMETLVSTRD